MSATFSMPDKSNIQGLILRGYTHPCSCHLLFSFLVGSKIADTKTFFNNLYPKVQSAADWGKQKPVSMLNIGLTFNGVKQLGIVAGGELANFPDAFTQGPWSAGSQASLTDVYDPKSVPSLWWNGQGDTVNASLHCIVHVYGLTPAHLDTLVNVVLASATSNGLQEILPLAPTNAGGRLYQTIVEDDAAKIHFGYTDGISEPALSVPGQSGIVKAEDYSNFLIGYSNSSISQPGPFDATSDGTFAKDGCYNAFRIIYQDVACFNQFLKEQATTWAETLSFLGLNDAELQEWFAAKLCGRWRNGSPLMLKPDKPGKFINTAAATEAFGYVEMDNPALQSTDPKNDVLSAGRCPFSAHTRVANPRNQNLTASEGTSGPPRIIRRGMPYGPTLQRTEDDGIDRGLIGLFLCGSLAGQFEFLYGWMNYNNFSSSPIFSINNPPQDALLANRELINYQNSFPGVVNSFTIPVEGLASGSITIPALPQWLSTRGTSYCLLPSIASLAKIAGIN